MGLLDKMKERSQSQTPYGGETKIEKAKITARDCDNCGAARAQLDGLTHCAYCGFEFLKVQLEDGIYISTNNNSK